MTCNLCGTQEATIHLTEIVNHQMMEIHLCEVCAQEKGTEFKTHFHTSDLASIINLEKTDKPSEKRASSRCPECGLTYEEFAKTGRLGCSFCYESFGKLLMPLIKRVQRAAQHIGKSPAKADSLKPPPVKAAVPSDLKILQDRLKKSIQSEAFEDAARIRDEIRQMEEKHKKIKKSKHES